MYISSLLINVGDNPDRPRPGRLWLRNLYHVHQRLCMAFPSKERTTDDPPFLKPYRPQDFPEDRYLADKNKMEVPIETLQQVHIPRGNDNNFLFRIDPQPGGSPVILVQSAIKPNWDYAFHNAGYLLRCYDVQPFNPIYQAGEHLRFRLLANPTRRLHEKSLERDGKPIKKESIGKRVPVPAEKLKEWLSEWRPKEVPSAGFLLDKESTIVQPGYIYFHKPEKHTEGKLGNKLKDGGKRLFSARYEGVLTVTDTELFQLTLIRGIGPGKAFGFGLLSVAPVGGTNA